MPLPTLPSTEGRVATYCHTHLYRDEPIFHLFPDAATAQRFARDHDHVVGQWRSGEVDNVTVGGFQGKLNPSGLLRYVGGGRCEPDMLAANPDLLLTLYYNGTLAEGPSFGTGSGGTFASILPDAWFKNAAPTPSGFGNYDMAPLVTGPSWTPPANNPWTGYGAAMGGAVANWKTMVWRHSQYMLDNHPAGPGVYKGIYLDIMSLNTNSQAEIQAVSDAFTTNLPNTHLTNNSLNDGTTYFAATGASSSLVAFAPMVNMEFFLKQPPALSSSWPTPGGGSGANSWLRDVSAAIDVQKRGKQVRLATKLYDNAAARPLISQWRNFVLASYLIANRGQAWIEFAPFGVSQQTDRSFPLTTNTYQAAWRFWDEGDPTVTDHQFYGVNLGPSVDPQDDVVDGSSSATRADAYRYNGVAGFYWRRFQNGWVFVNNSGASQTFQTPLPTNDVATGGTHPANTNLSIGPNVGRILLKQSGPNAGPPVVTITAP